MVARRLATYWLILLAAVSGAEARAEVGCGQVVVDVLDVFDEPDDTAYVSGRLKRGARVVLVPGGRRGWLAIKPPAGALDWVDRAAIRDTADGRAEVIADRAPVRSGSPEARMPGPPRPALSRGTMVALVDRPPMTLAQGRSTRVWRAIRPFDGGARFVRSEGVRRDPAPSPPERRANPEPTADPSAPVEAEVVAASASAPSQDSIAEAARRFDVAVARSRRLDHDVDQIRDRLTRARTIADRGYDAKGFLQASSRKVDGQKVHALIGPEGIPVAYLDIPPGIPTAPLIARKIGVRGSVRFNESLGTRLISVRDLDPLDAPR